MPVTAAGNIEYSKVRNVFRVSYRFRTPCPNCRSVLQLAPGPGGMANGIPQAFDPSEKTQCLEPSITDTTLPRTPATDKAPIEPAPTVRVKPPKKPEPKATAFRLMENQAGIRRPIHVSLKKRAYKSLPIIKIFLYVIIIASTSLTMAMTVLALRGGEKQEVKSPPVVPARSTSSTAEKSKPSAQFPDPEPTAAGKTASLPPSPAHLSDEPQISDHDEAEEALYVPRRIITSPFGKRADPFIPHTVEFHKGLDIATVNRAEIPVALDGTVSFVGRKGGYGNLVVVKHADGYETRYGHLAKILVKKGSKMKKGGVVGLAGSTGRTTGVHLHFEVRKGGRPVDPFRLELISRVVPKKNRVPSG
ncbi:MAG: M23 family metallopeptidase [Pseudomonadota bacterium]